jgi:hypothetical protein
LVEPAIAANGFAWAVRAPAEELTAIASGQYMLPESAAQLA